MANDNIFQQYLAPPKSIMEYSAEMDQADTRKQALQQNALTLAAGRQKFDEGQQASQRSALVRAALTGLPQGATDEQRVQAMRGTATPEGFAAADALSKSLIEQRKGTAAAAKDEAETDKTKLTRDVALHDFHAQKLATVQTPEEALAWAQEGNALGLFKQPGQYDRGVALIQQAAQDPQAFARWKAAAMQGGQSITEQLKQQLEQAKQAEQVRQFGATEQRIKSEAAATRAQSERHWQAEQVSQDDVMDPLAVHMAAQQYLAGDKGVLQNFGRGSQGAKNLNAVRSEVTKQATAAGLTGADIAAKMAEFEGLKAGQRTAGTRSAQIEIAAGEVDQLAPIALAASQEVSRSKFLPFGKMQDMFDINSNKPEVRKFAMANTALSNAYAQAMARGGKASVADMQHARDLLSTAFDQPSYAAAVSQLQVETKAAQAAPKKVRQDLSNATSGRDTQPASAPGRPGAAKPSLSDIFGH